MWNIFFKILEYEEQNNLDRIQDNVLLRDLKLFKVTKNKSSLKILVENRYKCK